jgi:hypothetical protein
MASKQEKKSNDARNDSSKRDICKDISFQLCEQKHREELSRLMWMAAH